MTTYLAPRSSVRDEDDLQNVIDQILANVGNKLSKDDLKFIKNFNFDAKLENAKRSKLQALLDRLLES